MGYMTIIGVNGEDNEFAIGYVAKIHAVSWRSCRFCKCNFSFDCEVEIYRFQRAF